MGTHIINQYKDIPPFAMRIKTDNPGTSGPNQFTLPTVSGQTYIYRIDWGDGTREIWRDDSPKTHTYDNPGEYLIRIAGNFPTIRFSGGGDVDKIININNLGVVGWKSLLNAFQYANNLLSIDNGGDTSDVTDLRYAWFGCSSLVSFPSIDASKATNLYQTWNSCSSLIDFPMIITSDDPTSFGYTWAGCNSLVNFPKIDTSKGTDFSGAWRSCSSLEEFPDIDTGNGINFYSAWEFCSSLQTFPDIDTSKGEYFQGTWRGCSSLIDFPSTINTSKATSFERTWQDCSSLQTFPDTDTSNGINFNFAWQGCSSLISFPEININNGTSFLYTWYNCRSLASFPEIHTSNGINFNAAWYNCSSLTDFPAGFFDTWAGAPNNQCFRYTWDLCNALTSQSVENILVSIDTSGVNAPGGATAGDNYIEIDYNVATGEPDITVAAVDLIRKGWEPYINGALRADPFDYATLDLDFATNKSLIDNVSGTNLITYTRSSSATYIGADGLIKTAAIDEPRFDHDPVTGDSLGLLIEESRTNSTLYSNTPNTQFPSSTIYTQNYAGLAPDNKFTATKIVVTATQINTGLRLAYWIGTTNNTRSIYVKTLTGGTVFFGQGGNGDQFLWDTSTLSYSSDIRHPTGSVEDVGNGWYRLSLGPYVISPGYPVGGNSYFTPRDPGEYLIWGTQSEVGTFPTSYIPTPATFTSRSTTATYYDANGTIQTAAIDVARDDAYFPDENGIMKPAGLLLEAAGTNNAYPSVPTISWTYNFIVPTYNAGLSPDGTNSAVLFTPTLNSSSSRAKQTATIPAGSGIVSFYAKSNGYGWVGVGSGSGNNWGYSSASYNLLTGQSRTYFLGTSGYKFISANPVGNGWHRLVFSYVSSSDFSGDYMFIGLTLNPTGDILNSYGSANGTDGMYIWGLQVEPTSNSYPSSYIPTVDSAVTRAADVSTSSAVTRGADLSSITGTNFSNFYEQSQGTFYAKGDQTYTDITNKFENVIRGGVYPNRSWGWTIIGGDNTFNAGTDNLNTGLFYTGLTPNVPFNYNIAQAQANNDSSIAADGIIKATASPTQTLYNIDSLYIGQDYSGHISHLAYYPRRLKDTSLEYLTQ